MPSLTPSPPAQIPLYPLNSLYSGTRLEQRRAQTARPAELARIPNFGLKMDFPRLHRFARFVIRSRFYFCFSVKRLKNQIWLTLPPACVKWRHERRGGMVEHCLSLQWGVMLTEEHTHISAAIHTHSLNHGCACTVTHAACF